MIEYLHRFLRFLEEVEHAHQSLGDEPADARIGNRHRQQVHDRVRHWRDLLTGHEFDYENRLCYQLDQRISALTNRQVMDRLAQLDQSFRETATKRRIFVLPETRGHHYDNVGFSPAFQVRFPRAASEVKSGRNCFALAEYTACVFHMLRASEYGLRALAVAAGIKAAPSVEACEMRTWGNLLEGLEKTLKSLRGSKPDPVVAQKLSFYSAVISDANALNDSLRTMTMHARKHDFKEAEARGAMMRSEAFLEQITAHGIKEDQRRVLDDGDFKVSSST